MVDNGLIDESFKDGKGIPFIALEGDGDDAKFRVTDEATEFLKTLKTPIALASIVGRYRTGKSLLVNRMLLDVKGGGFQVGATVNSCTKGLWVWDKPLKVKNKQGQDVNLLIIDSEGIGSLDADADHDAKIFALALLLSSYFIYNSVGSIDESALNSLSLVVELTKHIRTRAENESSEPETGAEFAQFFPHFLWVVRDFSLQLVDEGGASFTSKTYLERSLTPLGGFSEGVEVKNRIRRMLLAFFPNRDCVTLKRPVEDESMLQKLDDAEWSDFRPEFVEQVQALRTKIYQDAPPKCLHGKPLDGFMLSHLAVNYADAINNGTALNIGDAWQQVSKSRNVKAVEEAHEHYERAAAELVDEMPMTIEMLEEKHLEMRKAATADFKKTCIGAGADIEEYLHQLDERIRDEYKDLQNQNAQIGREKCEAAIAEAYAPLAEKVEAKGLATVKEYEAERAQVKAAYLEAIPDNPERMQVLNAFFEKEVPSAVGKIAAHQALLAEQALQEKEEALKTVQAEAKEAATKAAAEAEDFNTRLKHAESALEETAEREKELKTRSEEEKARLQKQLEEETGALKSELASTTERLEGEVQAAADKANAAAARASGALAEAEKKAMLAEGELKHTSEQLESLQRDKQAAAADVEKLRAKVKEAEAESSRLRSEGDAAGEEKRAVERKLEAAQEELEEARGEAKAAQAESASKADSASAERQAATAEKARLEERVSTLEASVKAKEAALAEEKAAREKVGKDKDQQEQMLRGSESSLRAENDNLRTRLEEAEAAVKALEGDVRTKEDALREKEAALRDASKAADAAVASGGAEVAELASARKKAEDEAASLKEEAASIKAELAKSREREAAAAAEAKAAAVAAAEAKAAAAAAAASAPKEGAGLGNEEMLKVLERQGKMQEEFNKESEQLTAKVKHLETENDNLHLVVMKLKESVERAEDAGYGGGEEVRSLLKRLKSVGSKGLAQGDANGAAPGQKGEPWVMLDKKQRPKNEIVFKPVQQDVFAQVAKQTGRSTEQVYKDHEAGRASQVPPPPPPPPPSVLTGHVSSLLPY